MKERPIPFSDAMALAAFNGSKTQTRRIVKSKIYGHDALRTDGILVSKDAICTRNNAWLAANGAGKWRIRTQEEFINDECPYGAVGDRLWVRESYYQFGHWEPVAGAKTKGGKQKWKFVADFREIRFENPAGSALRLGRHSKDSESMAWHKRLARFMPRSACRNVLEITCIRIERLQDITEDDAKAEGIKFKRPVDGEPCTYYDYIWKTEDSCEWFTDPKLSFKSLWYTINGPASWDENPWVWVIEFKRLDISK